MVTQEASDAFCGLLSNSIFFPRFLVPSLLAGFCSQIYNSNLQNILQECVENSHTSDLNITDQGKTENEAVVHCETETIQECSVGAENNHDVLKNKKLAGIHITPACLFTPRPQDSAESTINRKFYAISPPIYNEISNSNRSVATKLKQLCKERVVIGRNYDKKSLEDDAGAGQVKRVSLVQMFAAASEPPPAKPECLESVQKRCSSTSTTSYSDFTKQHIPASVQHQIKSCVERTVSADSDNESSPFYSSSNSRCEQEVSTKISKKQAYCIDSDYEILRPSAGKPPIILVSKGSSPVSVISYRKDGKEDVSEQQQTRRQSHQRFSKENERKSCAGSVKSDSKEDEEESSQNRNFNDQNLSSSDSDDKTQQKGSQNEFFGLSDERREYSEYQPASDQRHSSHYYPAADKRQSTRYHSASDKRQSFLHHSAFDKRREDSQYHPPSDQRHSSQYHPTSDKRQSSQNYSAFNKRDSSRYNPASDKWQSSRYHRAFNKRASSQYHPACDKHQSSRYLSASDKRQSSQYYPVSNKRQSSQYYPASDKRRSSQYHRVSEKRPSSQYYPASDKRQSSQYHPASDKRRNSKYYPASEKGRRSTHEEFLLASDVIDQKRRKKDNRNDFPGSSTNDQCVFASDKFAKKMKKTDRESHHQKTSHDQFFLASDLANKQTTRKRKISERRKSSQDHFFFASDLDYKNSKRNDMKRRVSSDDEFFLASDVDPIAVAKGGYLQSGKKFPDAEKEQTTKSKDYLSFDSRDGPFHDSGDSAIASQQIKQNRKQMLLEAGDSTTSVVEEENQIQGCSLDFISSLPGDFATKRIPLDCYHAKHLPILCGDCTKRHQCDMYSTCKCLARKNIKSKIVQQCDITTQTKRDSDNKHKRKYLKENSSSKKNCPCPNKMSMVYDANPCKTWDRGQRSKQCKPSKVKQHINFLQGLEIFKNMCGKNSTSSDSTDCTVLQSKNVSSPRGPNLPCNNVRKKRMLEIEGMKIKSRFIGNLQLSRIGGQYS